MITRTRRQTRALGAAIAAATLGASFVVFAPTAGAELLENSDAGDIRVQPDSSDEQSAPVIFAGQTNQAGANLQIVLNNKWTEGDRLLVSVTDSAGDNCASEAATISYSTAPTVAVAGPFEAGALSGDGDPADEDEAGVEPDIDISLMSSGACGDATDVIALTLSNDSQPEDEDGVEDHEWVITLSGVNYDVGSAVPAGPVRNAPYGENFDPGDDDTEPSWVVAPSTYGGNEWDDATERWTNGAYVSPVRISMGAPSQLVAGGGVQSVGPITISELDPSAFQADGNDNEFTITFDRLTGLDDSDASVVVNDKDDAEAEVTASGNELTVTYTIPSAGAEVLGSIRVVGLLGSPTGSEEGPIAASLESDWIEAEFLTSDGGGNSVISDVETGGPVVAEIGNILVVGERIGGANRYETAAWIALQAGCTDYAVVASGEEFADALSANYLAGALADVHGVSVPVVLTRSAALPGETASIISLLGVDNVYVIGGPNAVSPAVFSQLGGSIATSCGGVETSPQTTLNVVRLAGDNRYDTNEIVVDAASGLYPSGDDRSVVELHDGEAPARTALLATGTDFADALTAGPLAATNFPLILTTPGALSEQAQSTIDALEIDQIIILGGPSAISEDVQDEVEDLGVSTFRLAGDNRFETATEIADFARTATGPTEDSEGDYDAGLGYTSPVSLLTQAFNFADALSSGWFAGQAGANMVLTRPTVLHEHTAEWLGANSDSFGAVMALGQTAAVSAAVVAAANAAVS